MPYFKRTAPLCFYQNCRISFHCLCTLSFFKKAKTQNDLKLALGFTGINETKEATAKAFLNAIFRLSDT